jgi:hypothetical protein
METVDFVKQTAKLCPRQVEVGFRLLEQGIIQRLPADLRVGAICH